MFLASAALGAAMVKYGRKSEALGDKVPAKKKKEEERPARLWIPTVDQNYNIAVIRKKCVKQKQ